MTRMEKLRSTGAAERFSGLIDCLDNRELLLTEIEAIKDLKKDSVRIAGRKLSCYAMALLDVLEIEKYQDDDEDVKRLIVAFHSSVWQSWRRDDAKI